MIRTFLLLLLMTGMILPASAQLTLEECQRKAQDNYPLVTQYQLIRLSEEYSLANAAGPNNGHPPYTRKSRTDKTAELC